MHTVVARVFRRGASHTKSRKVPRLPKLREKRRATKPAHALLICSAPEWVLQELPAFFLTRSPAKTVESRQVASLRPPRKEHVHARQEAGEKGTEKEEGSLRVRVEAQRKAPLKIIGDTG